MSLSDVPWGSDDLMSVFGQIDIYVFDQLLKGRITPRMKVLDAGCGDGRNSMYLMKCGAEVFGIDADADRVDQVREVAAKCAPDLPETNFEVARLADLPFPDGQFDAVMCSAVLHFARDEAEFEGMLNELWRVLGHSGVFFARLASSIGIEDLVEQVRGRVHRLPDGTERFLVDQDYLSKTGERLGAELLDPIKTTNVQNLRAMTTWVLRKDTPHLSTRRAR